MSKNKNPTNILSRKGTKACKEVKRIKLKEKTNVLQQVIFKKSRNNKTELENVSKEIEIRKGMAWTKFNSLNHIWKSNVLNTHLKLKLYKTYICSIITYGCEAWTLDKNTVSCSNDYTYYCSINCSNSCLCCEFYLNK